MYIVLASLHPVTDFVGFSAYATNDQTPAANETILLPGVVTDAGGAYNPDTSTFTCPTTAYYYIYFSLYLSLTATYDDCHIDISMNDVQVVEVRHRSDCSDDKHLVMNVRFVLALHTLDIMGLVFIIYVAFQFFINPI